MNGNGGLVEGVDFVGMPTRELEAAVRFYGETLGLRRSVYIAERNYSEFETGNLTLSVYDAREDGSRAQRQPNALALHVEDVAAARETLEARGVSSPARHSTPASATWPSSPTPTATR